MVKKFTQADLEKIENEQELKTYRWIQPNFNFLGLPPLTDKEEKDFIHGLKKVFPYSVKLPPRKRGGKFFNYH